MDNNTIEQLQKILELEFANVIRITVKEALFCRTPKQPAMVLFAAHESLKDYQKLIRHAVDMVYLFAQENIISCEIDIILTPNDSSINPQMNNRRLRRKSKGFNLFHHGL